MAINTSNNCNNILEKKLPSRPKFLEPQELSKIIANEKPITIWVHVVVVAFIHLSFFPGIYLAFTKATWQTNLVAFTLYVLTEIGVTAGAHRLWSHKSYKAKLPLRVLLMLFYSLAFQGPLWQWARHHRIHHKYQETEADPHNANEGLWFSHIGWVMRCKHPDVIEKALETIDYSDLINDSVVMFHTRFYWPLLFFLSIFLPTVIPVYAWNESWYVACIVAVIVRLVLSLNGTFLVNSIAHAYGNRPYDKNILAAENLIATYFTLGEGWHNYHHAFPWDYRASELGFTSFNVSKGFIDMFAKIGWAYDLKTASPETVERRALRTGDGCRTKSREPEGSRTESSQSPDVEPDGCRTDFPPSPDVWGWDDADLGAEERKSATITYRKDD